jgi:hypothetical protein
VTWTVGTVPYGTGAGTPSFTGAFNISVQPSASQQGDTLTLLSSSVLSSVDAYTGQSIEAVLRSATTGNIDGFEGDSRVQ